jgi:hypothetical protein
MLSSIPRCLEGTQRASLHRTSNRQHHHRHHHHQQQRQQQVLILQRKPAGLFSWLLLVQVLLPMMRGHLVQHRHPGRRPTTQPTLGCQQQQQGPTLQHKQAGPSAQLLLVSVLLPTMQGHLVQHRRPWRRPTTPPTLGWWNLPPSSSPLCRGHVSTSSFRIG